MIWFTADWHLFHKNILEYEYRPYNSIQSMGEALIRNYNQNVKEDDTCFFLGDVFWGVQHEKARSLLGRLNGRKHLILGNHDEFRPFTYVEMGFESVHTSYRIQNARGQLILVHDPAPAGVFGDTAWLCGHVHSLFKYLPEKRVLNVGVDVWDYKPVSIDTVEETMNV